MNARRVIGQIVEMRGFSTRNGFLTNDSPPRFIPCRGDEDHLELATRLFKIKGDGDPTDEVNRRAKAAHLGRIAFTAGYATGQKTLWISFVDDKLRPSPRQLRWLKNYGIENDVTVILDANRGPINLYPADW